MSETSENLEKRIPSEEEQRLGRALHHVIGSPTVGSKTDNGIHYDEVTIDDGIPEEELPTFKQNIFGKSFDCIFTKSICHPHGPRSFRREHKKDHTRRKRGHAHPSHLPSYKSR